MVQLSKQDIDTVVQRIADVIRATFDAHGTTSRHAIRAKLRELPDEDRCLVEIFYRYIDEGIDSPGAPITESDLADAVQSVNDELVAHCEYDRCSLSQDEIERLYESSDVAVPLAKQLKRAAARDRSQTAADVAEQLEELVKGLRVRECASEADAPLEPFHIVAEIEAMTAESLVAALAIDQGKPDQNIAYFSPVESFFENFIDYHRPNRLDQATELVEYLRACLRDLHIVIVGDDHDPAPRVAPAPPRSDASLDGVCHDIYIVQILNGRVTAAVSVASESIRQGLASFDTVEDYFAFVFRSSGLIDEDSETKASPGEASQAEQPTSDQGKKSAHKHPMYIMGIAADGDIVGLKSYVVWT